MPRIGPGEGWGWLTTVSKAGKSKQGMILWNCQCKCGKTVVVRSDNLRNGHTQSCGCKSPERRVLSARPWWQQLGVAVLKLAAQDADNPPWCTKAGEWRAAKADAKEWLREPSDDLRLWCEAAGLRMDEVVRLARERWPPPVKKKHIPLWVPENTTTSGGVGEAGGGLGALEVPKNDN